MEGSIMFRMCGNDIVTIDWGDGTATDTFLLTPYIDPDYWGVNIFHDYSDKFIYTITITGKNITVLSISSEELVKINVNKCKTFERLTCNWTNLSYLDLSGCTALKNLSCYGSHDIHGCITHLDVSGCTALKSLNCNFNRLTHLNVSDCIYLDNLMCNYNQLKNLDVSKNTALELLRCQVNLLSDLNISTITEIKQLFCNDNQLTHLDISNNPVLIVLDCRRNQLTNLINSPNNKALHFLDIEYNELSSESINNFFETLHSNQSKPPPGFDSDRFRFVNVMGNPGAEECESSIAEYKGWIVIK